MNNSPRVREPRREDGPMKGEVSIVVDNLHMTYPSGDSKICALENLSFEIRKHEFFSVVGASGCGKTTLLKILAGIIRQSSGSIYFEGRKIEGPQKEIGVVFQNPVLLPWRNIIDNVLLPVDVQIRRRDDAYRQKAQNLLELVQLAGFEKKYPRELSGGMQQRVSIARALIQDPRLLLMDEPFGALDAMTRENLNIEIERIWRETQKTIFFITHSITEAIFLSDRVMALTPRPGTIDEILDIELPRPRTMEMMQSPQFGKLSQRIRAKFDKWGWRL